MNKITDTLTVGATETLSATVSPETATDKSVKFTSSDETIATVTPIQGKVTGVKAGTATITATTMNGETATCEITVTTPAKG
ncbi:TPA: Ig domain-containing protein [Enterococcus faecium]|nr:MULTISPECIES: Ig-like domain-containing protein [Enterococcus]NTL77170.1 Ig domain-containing protein [Enterococcus faecium]NVD83140.1 Ig domain-containing protein [Enterococcus faecium]NVE09954.1 Ig domain-containing protein [Enterococcus faecium]NVF25913.1 Ig domain-containing protein [Enterococcus faecium]WJW78219.1 Ig-like domain-containing protein [Enterococcus faecium]